MAEHLAEAAAVLELHDGVGGAVGGEEAQHRHDVRMAEAGERARLVEEALAAPREVVGRARAARHDLVALAHGELDWQVLLDRHDLGELAVEGAIGDAEATVADHRVESIVAQQGADGQGLDIVRSHDRTRIPLLDARSRPRAQAREKSPWNRHRGSAREPASPISASQSPPTPATAPCSVFPVSAG